MSEMKITAEWMDAKVAFKAFCLSRSVLNRLVREKRIRCCSLAEEGMERGKRLYDAVSIRGYLNKLADEGSAV